MPLKTPSPILAAFRLRRRFQVRGIVQGVGFRPFVHRLASGMVLTGWVQNDVTGVIIEAEGSALQLETFVQRLLAEAPRLARINEVTSQDITLIPGARGFEVIPSAHDGVLATTIGPDSAICDDCLHEMLTPENRRYRYPFINCTHCGPRYTLVRDLPYDRAMTSMSAFTQCPACQAEYTDPKHRRFHAEPNACPQCGPRLQWCDARNHSDVCDDAIAETLKRLRRGEIVAIKGLGGFHLVCDATCAEAVSELRRRKARDEKPFALMVLNTASARQWCDVSEEEAALLESIERPIVLLPKKTHVDATLAGIAPDMNTLGLMLPYTPLHYLLFHEALDRPTTLDWLEETQALTLVMTSANPGGEPLVIGNEEALQRLQGIADGWLMHDRAIVARCDDSVVRMSIREGSSLSRPVPQFIRRARGYTPRAIRLGGAVDAPPVLAVGGYFKNTVCVTRGDEAFLSPHIGSLDNAATCHAFDEAVEHLLRLLDVTPTYIAHDRHPDFYSTRAAAVLAQRFGVPMIGVAHHHAHIAAVAAQHRLDTPVLGLAFDGVGLGDDGTAWGGELLHLNGTQCERIGHLTPLHLAGGDRAAREPWRMAASVLAQSGRVSGVETFFSQHSAAATVAGMLLRAIEAGSPHAPLTTSMGRYFDAAAGALKVCERMSFEGQAAMRLEGLAHRYLSGKRNTCFPAQLPIDASAYRIKSGNALDILTLVYRLFDIDDVSYGAALFHGTLIAAVVEWVDAAARQWGIDQIACGGGCFANALLSRGISEGLRARGHTVWQAQAVPSNDGGLSLGQAWVARRTQATGFDKQVSD
ncbi:MAG: carbamoyltransferase HypF [Burkholderiales bacterium]|jgi:hydrogenase maturation protein HypF|nr:carbamoyltransferase HypF [Burkholderiales bacterium]